MGSMFRLSAEGITPAPGVKFFKAEEYARLIDANAMLDEAKAQADGIIRAAEENYAVRHDEGYRDGVEEGKLEHSEKMLETILSSVEFIENIEHTLVDVVNTALAFPGSFGGRPSIPARSSGQPAVRRLTAASVRSSKCSATLPMPSFESKNLPRLPAW